MRQSGILDPMSFRQQLTEQVGLGLLTADQARAVWDAFTSVPPGNEVRLRQTSETWKQLLGDVLRGRMSFNSALTRWRAYLLEPTRMFPPDAGSGVKETEGRHGWPTTPPGATRPRRLPVLQQEPPPEKIDRGCPSPIDVDPKERPVAFGPKRTGLGNNLTPREQSAPKSVYQTDQKVLVCGINKLGDRDVSTILRHREFDFSEPRPVLRPPPARAG